jgi:hypothetical protein
MDLGKTGWGSVAAYNERSDESSSYGATESLTSIWILSKLFWNFLKAMVLK